MRAAPARNGRVLGVAFSVAAHAAVFAALFAARPEPPQDLDLRLMNVTLIELPPPAEPLKPQVPVEPSPEPPPPQRSSFRETPKPPPPEVDPMPAGDAEKTTAGVAVSDSLLAGAATAGSGTSGGGCNMPRLLQNALRKDPLVRAAVARAHRGNAILVWNGDWVRHPGQEGNGLTAVREAMMWEIGFAPEACRAQPVHGLVLISLDDGPGAARLVVGSGQWRWTDLLHSRSRPQASL